HYCSDEGTVKDCSIMWAGNNGIHVEGSADTTSDNNTISDCIISECKNSGIRIEKNCEDSLITDCEIYDDGGDGVCNRGIQTQILNCNIHENDKNGVKISKASNTLIKWCDIRENGDYGVFEDSGATDTDARFNYWGHWSGPGGDGPGKGDGITAQVLYSPWLGYPAGTVPQTFYVDTTGKIQVAIDNATDGDTIRVYAGHYIENVEVNKRLDLIGNGSAAQGGNNTVISAGNSGDALYITADWVNITNFYVMTGISGENDMDVRADHVNITDCTLKISGGDALYLRNADFCTIDSCTVKDAGGHGISLNSYVFKRIYDSDNNTISNCTISDCTGDGIFIDEHCDDNMIIDCEIFDNGGNGISVHGDNHSIQSCDIHNNTGSGVYVNGSIFNSLTYCLLYWNQEDGANLYKSSFNSILHCKLHNNVDDGIGMIGAENNTISNCTIYGNTDKGLYLLSSHSNMVSKCDIYGNDDGLYAFTSHNNELSECDIHKNTNGLYLAFSNYNTISKSNIKDNSDYGVYAQANSVGTDARYNYWGHSKGPGGVGPGGGDAITINVLYSPWLCQEYGSFPQTYGYDGSGNSSDKLQSIINLAKKGDTIWVMSGNFKENIIIDKTLNFVGNGSKDTIIRGKEKGDVVRILRKADWVNLSGFQIIGSGGGGRGGPGLKDVGIHVLSDHNTIFDIIVADTYQGILLENSHHNVIRHMICRNNDRGITLAASDNNRLTNNTIAANTGIGIELIKSSFNTMTGNTITNNKLGILLKDSSRKNEAHENTIHKNRDFGIRVVNNEAYTINATRNWWGNDAGPCHPKDNPNHRGDNITDLVEFSPWLDEKGNLHYSPADSQDDEDDKGFLPANDAIITVFAMIVVVILSEGFERRRR
ncbi:MAG: right-handed parallel beta-helix repeat-containing protein, partial [Thermoplasmata archaeon]|nr:right-handed parallel beta-helix repeat-containing protein [Thermoplasmata archaeon]